MTARGLEIYEPEERWTLDIPVSRASRASVIDELWQAIVDGKPPLHDGAWGRTNLAVSLAILKSSAEGGRFSLEEVGECP